MKITTYLNFGGNCAEALQFYEKHLGGKVLMMMKHSEVPGMKAPPGMEDLVMHARITIANTDIMASDAQPGVFQPMRSAYLALGTDTSEDAERFYAALSEGGEVFMAMQETFFAHRFAMLRDKYGINWMIIHEKPMGPPSA